MQHINFILSIIGVVASIKTFIWKLVSKQKRKHRKHKSEMCQRFFMEWQSSSAILVFRCHTIMWVFGVQKVFHKGSYINDIYEVLETSFTCIFDIIIWRFISFHRTKRNIIQRTSPENIKSFDSCLESFWSRSLENCIESSSLKDFTRIRHLPRLLIVHDQPQAAWWCIQKNRNYFTGNMIQPK